jgi:hypothetical protein
MWKKWSANITKNGGLELEVDEGEMEKGLV